MRLSKVFLCFIIFTLIFMTACTKSNTTPKQGEQDNIPKQQEQHQKQDEQKSDSEEISIGDYFPITEGNTWEYRGEGNEYASFTREVEFNEGNKAQIKENSGGTISRSVYKISDSEIIRTFFQGESYEDKNFLEEESNENLIILKKPLEKGAKWDTTQGTREIIDLNATVETPSGTFENCIEIKVSYEHSTLYEYFAKGIGLVKREFESEGMMVISELEEYDIKK